ncbi:hypothetical protein LYNGBM3L_64730 [Moorena producens 3L]|uniref:Uncharacterized protein n=1 Tax=Moorena producens 3L TaxID=489825 RepID=F4Y1T7_9CYAN|nr:hypothetical protein LYNGBM3L_64730 [Moorena producens 3L]
MKLSEVIELVTPCLPAIFFELLALEATLSPLGERELLKPIGNNPTSSMLVMVTFSHLLILPYLF